MKKSNSYHPSFLELVRWFAKEFGFAALLLSFSMGALSVGIGIQYYDNMAQIPSTAILTRAADPSEYLGIEETSEEMVAQAPAVEQAAVDTSFLRYELYSRGFWFLVGGLVLFAAAGILAWFGMTRSKRATKHSLSMGLA